MKDMTQKEKGLRGRKKNLMRYFLVTKFLQVPFLAGRAGGKENWWDPVPDLLSNRNLEGCQHTKHIAGFSRSANMQSRAGSLKVNQGDCSLFVLQTE